MADWPFFKALKIGFVDGLGLSGSMPASMALICSTPPSGDWLLEMSPFSFVSCTSSMGFFSMSLCSLSLSWTMLPLVCVVAGARLRTLSSCGAAGTSSC